MSVRGTIAAFILVAAFGEEAWGGLHCLDRVRKAEARPAVATPDNLSSFRGIGLYNDPAELRWGVRLLGFDTFTANFVGEAKPAYLIICSRGADVGRADFNRQGRMLRLSLKERFFSDQPVFVRRFADDLFELYGVKRLKVADDVCFQDVTCFRGVSKHGEQFLILRLGNEAELFVRRLD